MLEEESLVHGSTAKKKEVTAPYFQLYKYSTPLDVLLVCMGIISSIICGILIPYANVLFGEVIGGIVDLTSGHNLTDIKDLEISVQFSTDTQHFLSTTVKLVAAISVCSYAAAVCFTYSSVRQTLRMRKLLFGKILNEDYRNIGSHDINQTKRFQIIITNEISKIEAGIGERVALLVFEKTTYAASIIWALSIGYDLAMVCVIIFPLKSLIMFFNNWLIRKCCTPELDTYKAAGAVAVEVLSSIKTVVAFGGEEKESKRYDKYVRQVKNHNIKSHLFEGINKSLFQFLMYACYAVFFWYGVNLIIENRSLPEEERMYTTGNVISIFFLGVLTSSYFGSGSQYLMDIKNARVAAYKVFKILDKEYMRKPDNVGIIHDFKSDIVFNNVNFSYPEKPTKQALHHVNLKVKFGESTALTGLSGSGKSSIVKLLQRLYDPISGDIFIDGVNLKNIDLQYLRNNVAVVGKTPSLFAGTVAENIRYGRLTATPDDIVKAAKMSNAHQFISNLPNGYQTVIGDIETQLSESQKLKIALSRALIKEPQLLILDEVTALLDSANELEVQTALDNIGEEFTTIVISDRLSTLRKARRIIVIDCGSVAEEGSHDELIAAKGAYYNMVDSGKIFEPHIERKRLPASNSLSFISYESAEDKDDSRKEVDTDTCLQSYKNLFFKIHKFNRPDWLQVMAVIGSLIVGASVPLYGWILGDICQVLAITDNNALNEEANFYNLRLVYLGIASGFAIFFQNFGFGYTGEKLKFRLSSDMFSAMLKQEMAWFDKKENSRLALCLQLANDPRRVQLAGGNRMNLFMKILSSALLSITMGLYMEWRLALMVVVFYPVITYLLFYSRNRFIMQADLTRKTLEKSTKIAVEAIDNIEMVKVLGCENIVYESYLKELDCTNIADRRSRMRALVKGSHARGILFLVYVAGIAYGLSLILDGEVDSATVLKVLLVMVPSAWYIGNILVEFTNIQGKVPAVSRVLALLERVPAIRSNSSSIRHQWKSSDIQFCQVHFSDPTKPTNKILNGLDLSVEHEKTMVVLGDSNVEKSTILHLLMRFYDLKNGAITIEGQDIRNFDLHCLRSQLGMIDTVPDLFNITIAENIGYGANDRAVSMVEIIDAAKSANIHNFIAGLPFGYETILDKKGELSVLSESQKHRIAIARTLLRNPKILFINEINSELDDESKQIIEDVLDKARQGRTCIVVSQSPTTIQKADVICVLKEGQVAEMGSHDELLAKQDQYYEYYNTVLSAAT